MFELKAHEIPIARIVHAQKTGGTRKLLFITGGGIGDRVCAEPTIRYAINRFSDCEVYVMTETPQLYAHLKVRKFFHPSEVKEVSSGYLPLYTYDQGALFNQFANGSLMNGVDYASVSALRRQLPVSYRELIVPEQGITFSPAIREVLEDEDAVIVHAGGIWKSRVLPRHWLVSLITGLIQAGLKPVVIGKDCGDTDLAFPTTSSVSQWLDLREQLNFSEFLEIIRTARAVVTNDSAPAHIAASGTAFIALLPTCRHPDSITHWRNGEFGHRTKAFYKTAAWDSYNDCPNHLDPVDISVLPNGLAIEDVLPTPSMVATWLAGVPRRRTRGPLL